MKKDFILTKYPSVAIEHEGQGRHYYVEIVYLDKILKEEVPIRFFELNPSQSQITQMIDNNIDDFGEPEKVVVYWGDTKFYVSFWVWIAVLVIGLVATYYYMGDLQITFSLGSVIFGIAILFVIYWVVSTIDKMGRGMPLFEAINPFLRPYDIYNDTFRNGMDFARKSDRTRNYKHW